MNTKYEFDVILLGITLFFSVIGCTQLIRHRKKVISYRASLILLLGGLTMTIASSVISSTITEQWGLKYILSFLALKKVNTPDEWFVLRYIAAWGYFIILCGITNLVSTIAANRSGIIKQ